MFQTCDYNCIYAEVPDHIFSHIRIIILSYHIASSFNISLNTHLTQEGPTTPTHHYAPPPPITPTKCNTAIISTHSLHYYQESDKTVISNFVNSKGQDDWVCITSTIYLYVSYVIVATRYFLWSSVEITEPVNECNVPQTFCKKFVSSIFVNSTANTRLSKLLMAHIWKSYVFNFFIIPHHNVCFNIC